MPRRLTSEQFELVIRRAAELQARAADQPGSEGMSEEEIVRIGRELGLSGAYLNQALAEVSAPPPAADGALDRVMGPADLRATRVMPGDATSVGRRLERYLTQQAFYTVLRRLPDRTVYEPATGIAAAVGRAAARAFGRSTMLRVPRLEVAVRDLEEGSVLVSLGTRLGTERAGFLAGGVLGGGAVAGVAATVLGIAVDPTAALLALPVFGGGMYGMRAAYRSTALRTQEEMEALLDRVEHDELPATLPPWQNRRR